MQIAIKRSALLQIPVRKRRRLKYLSRRWLGIPTPFDDDATGQRWLVFSDPRLRWNDVRRLIAIATLISEFDDVEPLPDSMSEFEKIRTWALSRMPEFPLDHATTTEQVPLEEWFGRPWLRINTTEGMTLFESDF